MTASFATLLGLGFFGSLFLVLINIGILMIWVFALLDLFRNPRVSGGGKALWLVVIIFLPIVGSLIYLVSRPDWAGEGAEKPTEEGRVMPRQV